MMFEEDVKEKRLLHRKMLKLRNYYKGINEEPLYLIKVVTLREDLQFAYVLNGRSIIFIHIIHNKRDTCFMNKG